MPGLYRHAMRQGIAARARLHTAEHDLDRLTLHVMDLERTLYRLAMTICVDKLVNLNETEQRALPHDETMTFLGDPFTQAQLYAILEHASELTLHTCPSCEGQGASETECVSCGGTGEIGERVTTEDRIRAIFDAVKPVDSL
jgi:hypothetical protein